MDGENAGTASSTANGGDGGIGTSEYTAFLEMASAGHVVSDLRYVCGGGGGGDYGVATDNTSGLGGYGGGGRRATAGIANTGGGGGGACENPSNTNVPGKAGGSGLVIVRYIPRGNGKMPLLGVY